MTDTYAVYVESSGYVHLVSGTSEAEVIDLLLKDIESVGENIKNAYNVYACKGGEEYPALENEVMALINKGE